MESAEHDLGAVLNDPFDDLALGELQGLGESGRKVDVPLFAGLAMNELDTGGETHKAHLRWLSSYMTR